MTSSFGLFIGIQIRCCVPQVAIDSKSSLARHRLVDFTGELQIRPRRQGETSSSDSPENPLFSTRLPEWQPKFVAEPAQNGGRNKNDDKDSSQLQSSSSSPFYAQELAPVPLQITPPSGLSNAAKPGVNRGRLQTNDIEPYYHTSFCNELLCHPRILHNCIKKIVATKVELRELEWNESFKAYLAHVPESGTAIHNPRRGPFLVPQAFTTCSFRNRSGEHHFLDDFKIKLPLDLKPRRKDGTSRNLVLVFTVFSVKISSKSMWKRAMKFSTSATDSSSESLQLDPSGKSRLEQVACGFLPVSSPCLLDDGMHDVHVIYKVKSPPKELCEQGRLPEDSLILVEGRNDSESQLGGKDDSYADDTVVSLDSAASDRHAVNEGGPRSEKSFASEFGGSIADDSVLSKSRHSFNDDPIALSVNILSMYGSELIPPLLTLPFLSFCGR